MALQYSILGLDKGVAVQRFQKTRTDKLDAVTYSQNEQPFKGLVILFARAYIGSSLGLTMLHTSTSSMNAFSSCPLTMSLGNL